MAKPHIPPALKKAYYQNRNTDLKKFGEGLATATGKPAENTLVQCPKCDHRHWTHQSCINLQTTKQPNKK